MIIVCLMMGNQLVSVTAPSCDLHLFIIRIIGYNTEILALQKKRSINQSFEMALIMQQTFPSSSSSASKLVRLSTAGSMTKVKKNYF